MTEPVTGLVEWEGGQAQPHVPVNQLIRAAMILAQRVVQSVVTAVPGSPADGDAYLVASAGTSGILVGHENEILYYAGGPKFLTARPGWLFHVYDENAERRYNGEAWQVYAPAWPPVEEETGTDRDATPDNAGILVLLTNAAAKSITFDAAQDFALNAEYHYRNMGAGDATLVAAGGFSLSPPGGGTLVFPEGATVTVKIIAIGTGAAAIVMGTTVDA
jgi:hypothetical protein